MHTNNVHFSLKNAKNFHVYLMYIFKQ